MTVAYPPGRRMVLADGVRMDLTVRAYTDTRAGVRVEGRHGGEAWVPITAAGELDWRSAEVDADAELGRRMVQAARETWLDRHFRREALRFAAQTARYFGVHLAARADDLRTRAEEVQREAALRVAATEEAVSDEACSLALRLAADGFPGGPDELLDCAAAILVNGEPGADPLPDL